MSRRAQRLGSRIRGRIRRIGNAISGDKGIIVTAWETMTGEVPKVSYDLMMSVYLGDYYARTAVDFQADQIAGGGHYLSGDDEYEYMDEAITAVEDFCKKINLDSLLQVTAREVVGFGNSFWQKNRDDEGKLIGVTLIPIQSIEKVMRDQDGVVQAYKQIASFGGKELPPEDIIHFRWNPVGNSAEGIGVISAICIGLKLKDGRVRDPLYKAVANMHQDIVEQQETWSAPNELWIFPEADDEDVNAWGAKLKNAPRRGARWATNIKDAKISLAAPMRPLGFPAGIETLTDAHVVALHTPIPKLISKTGFTEASANAAIEVAERITMSISRFTKRIIETELFDEIVKSTPVPAALNEAGEEVEPVEGETKQMLDPVAAAVRLNWGLPDVVDVELIQQMLPTFAMLWKDGGIKTSEMRAILRDLLHLEMIEETEEIEIKLEEVKSQPAPDEENGDDDNGGKIEEGRRPIRLRIVRH